MAEIKRLDGVGHGGRIDGAGWVERSFPLIVSGLAPATGPALLLDAYTALTLAGYDLNSEDTAIDGLYLAELRPEAISKTAVRFGLTYRRKDATTRDPNHIRISGEVGAAREATNVDKDGNPLEVSWKPEDGRPAKSQMVTVEKWIPTTSLEFGFTAIADNPAPHATTYVGYTNSTSFQGDTAGYWLCVGIPFTSADGGNTWDFSIKMMRHPNAWKETIYYVQDGDRPPPNWNAGYNSGLTVKTVEVYGQVDFTSLGLPNVMV